MKTTKSQRMYGSLEGLTTFYAVSVVLILAVIASYVQNL